MTTNSTRTTAKTSCHRFRRASRLLDAKAYSQVFSKARRSRDRYFTVLCRRRDSSEARLGLAVSKKNCRLAVGRTRIKRIVRESFRAHRALLAGVDVVVLNKAETHRASNKELFDSLENHWQQCQADTRQRAD